MLEVVIEPSFLLGTEVAHLQDYLSSSRSFSCHLTQIYLPRDLLCLDEKCTFNNSTSKTVEENKGPDSHWY